MGQKVHPFGFRLGIFEDWKACWFAKGSYGDSVMEDVKVRKYLADRLNMRDISNINIEKAVNSVKIVIRSSRPGVIIGKRGQEIEKIKAGLAAILKKNIDISVQEVKNAELDATLVVNNIVGQLEKRVGYKRLLKRAGYASMKSGARGIKICAAGRLGGAEIARSEWLRLGSVPLHTLRSRIDYGFAEAFTTYGIIGVKVWICTGNYSE